MVNQVVLHLHNDRGQVPHQRCDTLVHFNTFLTFANPSIKTLTDYRPILLLGLKAKSGRTVRSIHACFYERSRDPQELIDMSHLVLDDPKWLNDMKVKSWRCQL